MIMRLLRHTASSITKVRRFRWVIEMDRLVPQVRVRLWTLTWAQEASGRPTEHFPLTISGRPLRFDLYHSVRPQSIMPETAATPGDQVCNIAQTTEI